MPRRFLARFARRPDPAADAAAAPDPLDVYARAAPSPQQTVDIFKGAWSSRFPAATGIAAGDADLFADPRVQAALERIDVTGARVLELGPLEGAHSYMLQAAGAASVLAIEACVLSYLKCLIVKDLLALDRVAFQFGDFMPLLAESEETFDLIVASGVLYHQADPIELIRRLALRTDRVLIWTHYHGEPAAAGAIAADAFRRERSRDVDGFACDLYRLEYDAYLKDVKYRGGVADYTRWMGRADLLACLDYFGLGDVEILFEQTAHPYGPNLTLIARRAPARAPTVIEARQRRFAVEMQAIAGPVPWCVDEARITDGTLAVSGWAIPAGGDPSRIAVRVDGRAPYAIETGLDRPDVGFHYWFYPEGHRSGVTLRARLPAGAIDVQIEYVDRVTGEPLDPWHAFYVHVPDLDPGTPVPSLAQIGRAHAGNTQNQYLVEGFSLYVKLARALMVTAGRTFARTTAVLDFGCGCGRLARYLAAHAGCRVIGVDVDADSLAWCRSALAGDYRVCALQPPLDLPSASLDIVIAIDVLPHLREDDGWRWMQELARVCRPGGVLLVSIASARAVARARLSADQYERVRDLGFFDLSANPDLEGVIDDPTYYRNVFHSHAYVRERWPEAGLRVLGIVPGVVGNHNDLVVFERLERTSP